MKNSERNHQSQQKKLDEDFQLRIDNLNSHYQVSIAGIQKQILHHKKNLERQDVKIQSRLAKKQQQQTIALRTQGNLQTAQTNINALILSQPVIQPETITPEQRRTYQSTLSFYQDEINNFQRQLEESALDMKDTDVEIQELQSQRSEENGELADQQSELRKQAEVQQSKLKSIQAEKTGRESEIQKDLLEELREIKIPLQHLHNLEEALLKSWKTLSSLVPFNHEHMLARYVEITTSIIRHRREAFRTLSKQSLQVLDNQIKRTERSIQRIEAFLLAVRFLERCRYALCSDLVADLPGGSRSAGKDHLFVTG